MKSLVPICLWNVCEHLSINMSKSPRDKNITLGSFVIKRFRIWKAAVLPLHSNKTEKRVGLQVAVLVEEVLDGVVGFHVWLAQVSRGCAVD